MEFKVGDRVIANGRVDCLDIDGFLGTILDTTVGDNQNKYAIKFDNPINFCQYVTAGFWWVPEENLKHIDNYHWVIDECAPTGSIMAAYAGDWLYKNNNKHNMDLKERFVLAVTPEPQKSFRKAEITDGDNLLTQDGQKIFLTWLLGKYADEFKTAVVDGLLKKEDK